jgi:pSer/pThr/pTyr-binding forkhead associated (FHA) protein
VIGRGSEGVDLRIEDPGVSRRHAEIRAGFTTTITDLGSTNGTIVNGQLVSQSALEDGDEIVLGNSVMIYRRNPN